MGICVKKDVWDSQSAVTAGADGWRVAAHEVTVGDPGVAQGEASKGHKSRNREARAGKQSTAGTGCGGLPGVKAAEEARGSARSLPGMPTWPETQHS